MAQPSASRQRHRGEMTGIWIIEHDGSQRRPLRYGVRTLISCLESVRGDRPTASRSVSWMHCVEAWNLSVAVSAGKPSGLRQRIIVHRRKLIGRPDRKKA